MLLFILLLGLGLRLYGINFGLPYLFHQDEPIVVNHALAYGTGDLNPHFFNIPPFTSYVLFFFYGIYFVIGRIFGLFLDSESYAISFFKDPGAFYIIGRIVISVIPALLCILLTYIFAKKLFLKRTALYASLLMAVSFINVVNSHYIYPDMLLVVFTLLFYINIFNMLEYKTTGYYVLSAVFLGLAISTKYNAALLCPVFLLAHLFIERDKIFSRKLWLGFLISAIVFIATNPFLILSAGEFWHSLRQQSEAARYTGWLHHITYSLKEGISLPVLIFGIIGLFINVLKKGRKGILFFLFPIIFYLVLVFYSQPFPRYILVLVPFLCIAAAYFLLELVWGYCKGKASKAGLAFILAILILPNALKVIKALDLFCSQDTRVISAGWIYDNVPGNSKIACDSTFFKPVIKQPYSQLKEKENVISKQPTMTGLKNKKLHYMLEIARRGFREYPLYFMCEDPQAQGQFLNTMPAIALSIKAIKGAGIDYVVVNYAAKGEAKEHFLEELKKNAVLLKAFSPYYDNKMRYSLDRFEMTCLPAGSEELFSRRCAGPALEIYKVKK